MNDLLYIGQWQGFFSYGPEYGDLICGHEVEFRLFIEEYNDGQFRGRVIDWEGIEANGKTAKVEGFIHADFISFTKHYAEYYMLDDWGNESVDQDIPGHCVTYEGKFDVNRNCFSGSWEITLNSEQVGEFTIEEISTGKWRLKRED